MRTVVMPVQMAYSGLASGSRQSCRSTSRSATTTTTTNTTTRAFAGVLFLGACVTLFMFLVIVWPGLGDHQVSVMHGLQTLKNGGPSYHVEFPARAVCQLHVTVQPDIQMLCVSSEVCSTHVWRLSLYSSPAL